MAYRSTRQKARGRWDEDAFNLPRGWSKDRDYPTNYIPSNIADMFSRHTSEVEKMFPYKSTHGPDLSSKDYRRRLRAERILHLPGYAEALVEEIEAELAYAAVKHGFRRSKNIEKRRAFLAARERLYRSRWKVKELEHKIYYGSQFEHMTSGEWNDDPVKSKLDKELWETWREENKARFQEEARLLREELQREATEEEQEQEEALTFTDGMPPLPNFFQKKTTKKSPSSSSSN